jgi:hypothetical protein
MFCATRTFGAAAQAGSDIEARDLWAKNNALRGVFLGGALLEEYPPRPRENVCVQTSTTAPSEPAELLDPAALASQIAKLANGGARVLADD